MDPLIIAIIVAVFTLIVLFSGIPSSYSKNGNEIANHDYVIKRLAPSRGL